LDQGQLAEEGTHDELMARDGLYAKLQAEQTGESAEGRDGAAAKPPVAVEAARLKSVPLFGEMGPRELEGLAARLMLERFAPGEEIVRQNAPGDRLYILSSGQAEAVVADGSGERRVNVLNEGDYFGETALLSGQPRNATVRPRCPRNC
jgi:ATP-binding cassette subfamily B protein